MSERKISIERRAAYGGRDRRRQPLGAAGGDLVAAGAVALGAAYALAFAATLVFPDVDLGTALAARGVLDAIAATIAATAGVLGVLHWRLVGITRSLWSGAAFLVLAGLAIPALAAPSGAGSSSDLLSVRLGLEVGALVVLAVGAARPPVDARVRPAMIVGFAALVAAVTVGLLVLDADAAATMGRHPSWLAVAFLVVAACTHCV